MGSRISPTFGLVLIDRFLSGELSETDSTYSQAGPSPGNPEPTDAASRWLPYIRGGQSNALRLITVKPGYPKPSGQGASVAYRLATDTANTSYRGWSPPNVITHWTAPSALWNVTATTHYAFAANPVTGVIVVIVSDGTAANAATYQYDPRSDAWTTGYAWPAGLPTERAMAYDPDVPGRLIVWAGIGDAGDLGALSYYSDDDGDSWQLYSTGPWSHEVNGSYSIGVAQGIEWLAVAVGASNIFTWYSDTRGVTWTRNENINAYGTSFQVLRIPGAWAILYLADATNYPSVRILRSARSSFADAEEITIDSTAAGKIAGTVDADGRIWVITAPTGATAPARDVWRSNDGENWQQMWWGLQIPGSASAHTAYKLLSAVGRTWMLTTTTSSGGTNPTSADLHLIGLGGWATLESGSLDGNYNSGRERFGYGTYAGSGSRSEALGLWLPYDEPDDVGGDWAPAVDGSGGTLDLTVEPGMEIDVAGASNGQRYRRTSGGSYATMAGEAIVRIAAGGPNLGSVTAPTTKISILPELSDGSYRYELEIRLGLDGVEAVDLGSSPVTSLGTLALTGSTYTHIRWHITKGKAWVWARQGASTQWQSVADGGTLTNVGSTAVTHDRITWGNGALGSSDTVSYWRLVGASSGAGWHEGVEPIALLDLTLANRPIGLRYGRPATPSTAYPIPDASDAGEALGFLGTAGGPSASRETVDLPLQYRHGIDNADPLVEPSPHVYWESTSGATNQVLVWDAGTDGERWRGGAMALVALRARAASVELAIDDGGGGWTVLGTLQLQIEPGQALEYLMTGSTIRPNSGSGDSLSRYFQEGELVGGHVRLDDGSDIHREIVANSPGYWADDSTVQQMRITVDGADGTEVSPSSCNIYHHSGVLVVYPTSEITPQKIRVTVAGLAGDDEPTHRAGIIGIGRLVAVGGVPGKDWTKRIDLARRIERAADGAPRVVRDGPSREVWSYGWTDGALLQDLRLLSEDPDYFGISGGHPIATKGDAFALWRYVDDALQSGEVPCVVIPVLPTTSGTSLLDPTRYLYGLMVTDSYLISGVTGVEGTNEGVRVDGVTIEGFGR